MYVVLPSHPWWFGGNWQEGKALPADFRYTSDSNRAWLDVADLQALVEGAKR